MPRVPDVVAAVLVLQLAVGCTSTGGPHEGTIRVFAAASLTDVLEALVDTFETTVDGAPQVQLHLAGSSLLARQIEHGAGADVFISAHPSWTSYLAEKGLLRSLAVVSISNRLVLASRRAGQQFVDLERLALADPAHVPAGIYARSALECEGLWTVVERRTAATVDVRAALAAVEEGAADAAVVYRSDARFAQHLHITEPFSEACQPDITYTVGLAPSAKPGAARFAEFLSDSLRAPLWEAFGFARRVVHADPPTF